MIATSANQIFVSSLGAHFDDLGKLRNASEDDVRAWLLQRGVRLGSAAGRRSVCSALRPGEVECAAGWHTRMEGGAVRCPVQLLTDRRRAMAPLLHSCGIPKDFDEQAQDLSEALLSRIDVNRRVEGLGHLVGVLRDAVEDPLRANTALIGSCGTAKTAGLLAIYFAALRKGLRTQWLTSGLLRELAHQLNSHDQETRLRAVGQRQTWARAELLVLDDLADRPSARGANISGLLIDLVASGAVWAWSSNLSDGALTEHDDVGPRVVSRLFGDRDGHACRVASLTGDDQRQHAMRSAPASRPRSRDGRALAAGGRS